jgi:hypothetical protein
MKPRQPTRFTAGPGANSGPHCAGKMRRINARHGTRDRARSHYSDI